TRVAFRIEVVEPPQIERLALDSLYPEYTGLNRIDEKTDRPERQPVPVLGAQVSLPAGTDFILQARSNKPLRRFRVQTERFEISAERGALQASISTAASAQTAFVKQTLATPLPLLSEDGRTIMVPCLLAVVAEPELVSAEG